jgi:hypothetical protein
MHEYSIITINGASGPFIANTIRRLGCTSEYNTFKPLSDDQKAVVISYQHSTFAWVMTSHFLENIKYNYVNGDTSWYDGWRRHWIGPDDISSPLDITPESWAKHVLLSYNHIGKYAPLNGLYEEVTKVIQNDNCIRYHIELERLIQNPESVIAQLNDITKKEIESVNIDFLSKWARKKQEMKPWMDAILQENNGTRNLTINHFGHTIQLLID